ncbi:PAAR domain-containing protein [Pseudomonas sp. NPDC007930]|uniref:PAAR domain-containing protein n=1 Tax=Pseudomonas sp. NPDC007930 TaxID=3364417 RepID=UPI0036E2B8F8
MRPPVRQGDTLSPFGGEVLQGHFRALQKPLACVGAQVRCAQHGLTQIAEGSGHCRVNGQAVALHGHRCACGCTLVSSLAAAQMRVRS